MALHRTQSTYPYCIGALRHQRTWNPYDTLFANGRYGLSSVAEVLYWYVEPYDRFIPRLLSSAVCRRWRNSKKRTNEPPLLCKSSFFKTTCFLFIMSAAFSRTRTLLALKEAHPMAMSKWWGKKRHAEAEVSRFVVQVGVQRHCN